MERWEVERGREGERERAVDRCPVTRHQKLKLYKLGICPRLNWPLTIHEFSISWIEREVEAMATRFLKRWAGLAKSANPNLLYVPPIKRQWP